MSSNYSLNKDIEIVLTKTQHLLEEIEQQYKDSLHVQEVTNELLTNIKDLLGHYRSALDYASNRRVGRNFPVRDTQSDFDNATDKIIDKKAKKIMERYQPFNNNEWLKSMNILNNKNKHIGLVPQKKTERNETRVTHPQGGSVSWTDGATFGSGVAVLGVPIDPNTQLPVSNDIVKTEQIKWISFVFDNANIPDLPSNINALPFLKNCFEKICLIIKELEANE